jgi:ubiquitin C-terminal hydrolase
VFNCDRTIPLYPEVVGIYNFHNNCFLNAALQVLKAIPNVIKYKAKIEQVPERLSANTQHTSETIAFNEFLSAMMNALFDMDECKTLFIPEGLRQLSYFNAQSSCEQVISDFLSTEGDIGICKEGRTQRIISVDNKSLFKDFIQTFNGATTSDFLLFHVVRAMKTNSPYQMPFPYDFPNSFEIMITHDSSDVFLLKAVVCHNSNHYTTYVRRSFTNRFLLINDGKVTEAKIEPNYVHMALYLKCPH